jgi:uncharacterized protein YggE
MNSSLTAALTRLSYVGAVVLLLVGVWAISKVYVEFMPQPSEPATVTVDGTGEAVGIPDIATMSFSVVEQADTVAEVTESANAAMDKIVTTLKGAGIADADLQTTAYNLNPRYDYSENKSGEIIGYSITQSVTVKIRNLDDISSVVDAATNAGANDVTSPVFEIDDPDRVKAEAREEAFAKAEAKAKSLAEAAGVRLGDIVTFSESDGGVSPQPYYLERSLGIASADSYEPSIEVGSQEVSVTVSVTYALR